MDESSDKEYQLFLDHLKPDGNAYHLQIPSTPTSNPIFIKYEHNHNDGDDVADGDDALIISKNKNKKKEIDNKVDDEFQEDETWSSLDLGEIFNSHRTQQSVDRTHLNFLQHLRLIRDDSMALHLGDGSLIKYDLGKKQEEEEKEEEEIVEVEEDQEEEEEEHHTNNWPNSSGEHQQNVSSFKGKLMAALNRPFDQMEYDRLMKQASERKLVVKFRELRGGVNKDHETGIPGSSYFDHYKELRKKVNSADPFSGLTLLRGFFFWLKNIEHEGAYPPWT